MLAHRRATSSFLHTARRTLATVADSGFASSTVEGVKLATKEVDTPISTLSFVVKAGSRYSTTPGVAHALERYAFQNTKTRSALRITRESEFLGASFSPSLSRDAIVLTAEFLKDDLAYFFEVLSDVFARPHLARHELAEVVGTLLKLDSTAAAADPSVAVTEALHLAAYRRGLGLPLYAQPSDSISATSVSDYKDIVYTKANLAIVGSGISLDKLSPLVADFLEDAPAGTDVPLPSSPFYAGDVRVPSTAGNAVALGYATSSSAPEFAVLAALLGGTPSIKWSYGSSLLATATQGKAVASLTPYAGSSLFKIIASAGSAEDTSAAAAAAASVLKSVASKPVSSDDLKKAIAQAKFAAVSPLEGKPGLTATGVSLLTTGAVPDTAAILSALDSVTAEKVKSAAEAVVSKVAVAAVGKVAELPYADELL
ncbi:processing/enhancing protein [Myxozyma melibiosi]|uniref:Cytochrome b-c1 complex subunit 2, mitochondrial n=1 Tax=Myxozyma melibiosi TaxID=54550 RepID=A0ABR1F0U2_9ASCO